jgi:hypothetical protein
MRYLHTDEQLNGREKPLPLEQELLEAVDSLLADLDPPGIIRGEAMWWLRAAPEGENNVEVLLPLGWDHEVRLRVLLVEENFSLGWGGEFGESVAFESFQANRASADEMTAAFRQELSRDIRVSRRRLLFAGASELHIRHGDAWIDLLRGGIPSGDKALRAAVREVTLMA